MNNPENEQEEHEYPYKPQPGKTHWGDCWKAPGHHNCAVARVYRLQRRLEEVEEERERLKDKVNKWIFRRSATRRRVDRLEEAVREVMENRPTKAGRRRGYEEVPYDAIKALRRAYEALDSREDEVIPMDVCPYNSPRDAPGCFQEVNTSKWKVRDFCPVHGKDEGDAAGLGPLNDKPLDITIHADSEE